MPGPWTDLRRRRARRLLFLLAGFTFVAWPSAAQTIRPVVVQYRQTHAQGRFEVVNDGLVPLTVVLEPQSFDVTDDGEAIYRPLDAAIHLKLSAMSFRIGPRQTRVVFYDVTTDSGPNWFVIPCTFSGLPRRNGLDVRIELPHTVYVGQSESPSRDDIVLRSSEYLPAEHVLHVELENRGDRLGRAQEIEVIGMGHRERAPSFPLLPHGRRRLRIPWSAATGPDRMIVRFPNFTLERSLGQAAQDER